MHCKANPHSNVEHRHLESVLLSGTGTYIYIYIYIYIYVSTNICSCWIYMRPFNGHTTDIHLLAITLSDASAPYQLGQRAAAPETGRAFRKISQMIQFFNRPASAVNSNGKAWVVLRCFYQRGAYRLSHAKHIALLNT